MTVKCRVPVAFWGKTLLIPMFKSASCLLGGVEVRFCKMRSFLLKPNLSCGLLLSYRFINPLINLFGFNLKPSTFTGGSGTIWWAFFYSLALLLMLFGLNDVLAELIGECRTAKSSVVCSFLFYNLQRVTYEF